ncbi:hypothetical protein R1sor_020871 [Riccia sorocarpa]|uniref:Uncharacterized protein n=1 Tax=Riccia sorocarpa TaxID=122646 RepID=A0ABD3GIJ9_9MARC
MGSAFLNCERPQQRPDALSGMPLVMRWWFLVSVYSFQDRFDLRADCVDSQSNACIGNADLARFLIWCSQRYVKLALR